MGKNAENGKKQDPEPRKEEGVERNPVKAVVACTLGWVLPGAGHFFLGRFFRGVVFLVTVTFLFGFGLYLGGKTYPKSKKTRDPSMRYHVEEGTDILSYFATFACLGNGPAYFVVRKSRKLNYGQGDLLAASHEYGTTFILVAGLLNMLLILDAFDIAMGRKP